MATQIQSRLDPAIFRLPVDRIRQGYYSDAYFVYTKETLEAEKHHPHVTMQVFQKRDSVLGGIDEAIAILKLCSGHQGNGTWISGWDDLEVHALREGDQIAPRETVLTIEGNYSLFAHLETVYLGSLARRSLIMRNVLEVVEAARGKQIFYFPARHDHWLVQTGDGAWIAGWDDLEVHALREGDQITPHETVMTIEGDYSLFAHLETVYLGSLARRSLIMRNVLQVVEAARGKQIFYFPARHDHWLVQTGDGWSAHVAGAIGVSTDAQASWWGGRGIGTVPHGLIAAYGGDTVKAATVFADRYEGEMNITVLVDFENDSVRTALEVAEALGSKLWGVRLDTSEDLVDRSLFDEMGGFKPTGVNPRLVENVRNALDSAGYPDVHIVASGGFNAERIREFEAAGVPVDAYGVGSSLIRGDNDFTADIVCVDGRPCAKVGRRYAPNPRLERVE